MSDAERLTQITARAEAATPGPWEHRSSGTGIRGGGSYDFVVNGNESGIIAERHNGGTPQDAAFIAHAREDVPWMAKRILELEAKLTEAKARAWDKGYNKGREDAKDWTVRIVGVRGKPSRNPYRHGGA